MISKPEMEQHLQDFSYLVCDHVPEHYEIRLCFERHTAWVELVGRKREKIPLALNDPHGMTLVEQINEALSVAGRLQ